MNSSYWANGELAKRYPPPTGDLSVDVLVVGGGLMGVSCAYLLSQQGKKVALLEREAIASGDTGHTTAHLTAVPDMGLTELAKTFGDEGARLIWDAGAACIDLIRDIINRCGIACDFAMAPAFLHLPFLSHIDCPKPEEVLVDHISRLHSDAEVAQRLGIPARIMERSPLTGGLGLAFPNQARFHPLKYIQGLLLELERSNCRIFEESPAEEFSDDGNTVRTGQCRIQADKVIIATHLPIVGSAGAVKSTLLQTKLYPYTTYAIAAKTTDHFIPDALFWDTLDPYHYLRIQPAGGEPVVIYGGRDNKTGQAEDTSEVYSRLEEDLAGILQTQRIGHKILNRWQGQVIETNDGGPFIGEVADNQFIGTGFAGNGMTFATLAAMMACDWVAQRASAYFELLSPSRSNILSGALDYIKENADYPYYMVRDRLRGSDAASPDEVVAGQGKVMQWRGQRVAVYRDSEGNVTQLSAVCTHLGCLVHWNSAGQSWDCPCHGSRFHPTGEVMSGPAETPLERVSDLESSRQK